MHIQGGTLEGVAEQECYRGYGEFHLGFVPGLGQFEHYTVDLQ